MHGESLDNMHAEDWRDALGVCFDSWDAFSASKSRRFIPLILGEETGTCLDDDIDPYLVPSATFYSFRGVGIGIFSPAGYHPP